MDPATMRSYSLYRIGSRTEVVAPKPLLLNSEEGRRQFDIKEVIDVHDGDTVKLRVDLGFHISIIEKFRLSGINAFELSHPRGPEARDFAAKFLADCSPHLKVEAIKRPSDGDMAQEKFGRWLGYCWGYDDASKVWRCLNQELVNAGLAVKFMAPGSRVEG